MEEYFEGLVTEVENDIETAYMLENENLFYDIGFRVMQNEENQALFHCYKLKYNGKTKLVYFTSEYQSVYDLCGRVSVERFCLLIEKLTQTINQIESLGFLNMAFVDNRLTHIFVDRTEQKVRIIYLPVSEQKIRKNKNIFENELKSQLIRLVEERYPMSEAKTGALLQILKDATLTLQQVGSMVANVGSDMNGMQLTSTEKLKTQLLNQSAKAMAEEHIMHSSGIRTNDAVMPMGEWRLEGVNNPYVFLIDKQEYIIGKSKERVDGVITDNPAVSRVHCKFVTQRSLLVLMDLGSANGTYVDGKKLVANVSQNIMPGNRIRIANMDFIIRG